MQYMGYMAAAYTIIWVVMMLYFLSLAKREKAIWEELQELRAAIGRDETPAEGS